MNSGFVDKEQGAVLTSERALKLAVQRAAETKIKETVKKLGIERRALKNLKRRHKKSSANKGNDLVKEARHFDFRRTRARVRTLESRH